MPLVSVIIPVYNGSSFIEDAIHSVLDQSFQDFEIMVVDDGSTDDTRDKVKHFNDERIKYIFQQNMGLSSARNTGINVSGGEYIALLDADDVWLPAKLELQLKVIETSPHIGLVYSDVYNFDSRNNAITGTYLKGYQGNPPQGYVLEKFVDRYFGHPSTLLIRRSALLSVGLFDENLRGCEDDDFLFRMALAFQFGVVPEPLIKYRIHPGQMTQDDEKTIPSHIIYSNKALSLPMSNDHVKKKLYADLARFHFRYGIINAKKYRFAQALLNLSISFRTNRRIFFSQAGVVFKRILTPRYNKELVSTLTYLLFQLTLAY